LVSCFRCARLVCSYPFSSAKGRPLCGTKLGVSTAKNVGFVFAALICLCILAVLAWNVSKLCNAPGVRDDDSSIPSTRPGMFARLFARLGKDKIKARDAELADVSPQPRSFATHSVVALSDEPCITNPVAGPSWSGGFSGGFVGTHTVFTTHPDDPSVPISVVGPFAGQRNDNFVGTHTVGTGSYPRPQ
jgi:hypothetical protein